MKDRFTDASTELAGKSAFVCTSCEERYGHATIMPLEENMDIQARTATGYGLETRSTECILFCDPMPFGD